MTEPDRPAPIAQTTRELLAWDQLVRRAAALLAEERIDGAWTGQLVGLALSMRELARRDADTALYVLLHAAGSGAEHYSARHAMACAVTVDLAGRWLAWSDMEVEALMLAALSMNISMTGMHDELAQQDSALTDAQRTVVDAHAGASAEMLAAAGVADPLWLYAVRHHHEPGIAAAVEGEEPGPRLAELLRRVDVYTAKLSRRASRDPITPAIAARDACLGAAGHPDSIGATLLRVLGLYPPGTYVALANGDAGIVVRRGPKAHTPVVASLRRADGGLLMPPVRRDTALREYAVRRGLEPGQVRVRLDHGRVLARA